MSRHIIMTACLAAVLAISLGAPSAMAEGSRQEQFLSQLGDNAEKVDSISSEFLQQSFITLFKDKVESRGSFTFQRPDKLRWEYSSPFASGFLINGRQGLRWDEAAAPTPFKMSSAPEMAIISEQILAWTKMDIDWLKSRYKINVTQYSPAIMELEPKSKAAGKFMKLIRIFFSADTSHLQALELHEPGGDYTRIDFEKVRINSPLPAAIFQGK